jgi:hypothetical protein
MLKRATPSTLAAFAGDVEPARSLSNADISTAL